MSTVSPTLIPRAPYFPILLPEPPKPHPLPLPPNTGHPTGRLNSWRSLINEMDDLSDEEGDVDDHWKTMVKNRGFNFLHVIGRLLTQQEEKNDQADSDSDDSGSGHSGAPLSTMEEGENDSAHDLDANLQDMDDTGDMTGDTEDLEDLDEQVEDLDDYNDEDQGI